MKFEIEKNRVKKCLFSREKEIKQL